MSSDDGLNWTAVRTEPPTDHEGVAYGDGYWMVVGGYFTSVGENHAVSTVFVSTNRLDWRLVDFDAGVRLRDVTFANGLFVAVGNDGAVAVFSAVGDRPDPIRLVISYSASSVSPFGPGFGNLRRVRFQEGVFVTVGNDGAILSSQDPRLPESWIHHRSRTSQNLHDIVVAPDGTFCAVGNNGMILESRTSESAFTGIHLANGDVRLEFRSRNSGGALRIEESPDLQTWRTVVEPTKSPIVIPFNGSGARFFRLVAP